jgi:hypothetical protein
MFKAVLTIAGLGVLLLLVAIIVLVWVNWSERFYGQLGTLTVAFLTTVAALIIVFAMLKGDTVSDAFTTFIVVNSDTHLPQWPGVVQFPVKPYSLVDRLIRHCGLASPKILDGTTGKELILFEGPHNESDEIGFYEELLQYKLLMEIIGMHNPNPSVTVTVGPPGISIGDTKPFKLSEAERRPLMDFWPEISKARFCNNPVEKGLIQYSFSRLPKNTAIKLERVTSEEITPHEKHVLILTKPYFFKIEITIEPGIYPAQKALPANAGIAPEVADKCKLLMFQISMTARFDRITSGNPRTGELKDWASWMFAQLQRRYSDTTPE